MRAVFHPEARQEFKDAAAYYAERQPGLEHRFVACVENAVQRILESPAQWRTIDGEIRRCFTPVFPYAILYEIHEKMVIIMAVMHCHREPGYWQHRGKRGTPDRK